MDALIIDEVPDFSLETIRPRGRAPRMPGAAATVQQEAATLVAIRPRDAEDGAQANVCPGGAEALAADHGGQEPGKLLRQVGVSLSFKKNAGVLSATPKVDGVI